MYVFIRKSVKLMVKNPPVKLYKTRQFWNTHQSTRIFHSRVFKYKVNGKKDFFSKDYDKEITSNNVVIYLNKENG